MTIGIGMVSFDLQIWLIFTGVETNKLEFCFLQRFFFLDFCSLVVATNYAAEEVGGKFSFRIF